MTWLIGARAMQGFGGGSIISLTQIIIGDIVPLHKRGVSREKVGGSFWCHELMMMYGG